jgi:hypothetical protein
MYATSGFLLNICHRCQSEPLPNGRITIIVGFDYCLIVHTVELTLKDLCMEISKFPYSQNEKSMPRYYDHTYDNSMQH